MAILAEVGADFVLPADGASAVESLIYLGAEREC